MNILTKLLSRLRGPAKPAAPLRMPPPPADDSQPGGGLSPERWKHYQTLEKAHASMLDEADGAWGAFNEQFNSSDFEDSELAGAIRKASAGLVTKDRRNSNFGRNVRAGDSVQGLNDVLASEDQNDPNNLNSRVEALIRYLCFQSSGLWSSDHWRESQTNTGWNYCATQAIATQAQQAECTVYRVIKRKKLQKLLEKLRDAGRIEIKDAAHQDHKLERRVPVGEDHSLQDLLNHPNPGMSGAFLRLQIAQQISVTGTALIYCVENQAGVPTLLCVVPTGLAIPQPPSVVHPLGSYRVSPLAAFASHADGFSAPGALGNLLTVGAVLDARNVFKVVLPHTAYLADGYSPLAAGAVAVDVQNQIDNARWYSMRNSIKPGVMVDVDPAAEMTPEQFNAWLRELEARQAGTQNTGKVMMGLKGFKFNRWDMTPAEMDYAEAYPQARGAVLALHGTPLVAIGQMDEASYAAAYAGLSAWVNLKVQPLLDLIASVLTHHLAPRFARPGETLEVEITARAHNDPELELKKQGLKDSENKTKIASRCYTVNEYRIANGDPPTTEPWGDERVGGSLKISEKDEAGSAEDGSEREADETRTGTGDPVRQSMPKVGTNGRQM
jgi:hypothetical protein